MTNFFCQEDKALRGAVGEKLDDHLCLFNTEAYHRANMGAGQSYVRIDHQALGRPVGALAGVLDGDVLDCGWRAPFGGVDLTNRAELVGKVVGLVGEAVDRARALGARRLRVRCRPTYYSPQESAIQYALLSNGFAVETAELSLGIDVTALSTVGHYLSTMSATARTVVRHGLAAGLQWRAAETETQWAEGHGVLAAAKARLGAKIKYDVTYLLAMAGRFDGRVRMYLVEAVGRVVAAALIYRVLPGIDYVAAWGDAAHELPHSPMNLLAYRIVEQALADKVRLVDLGVSTNGREPNDGLIQFKRHIGGRPALRLDLIRDLRA